MSDILKISKSEFIEILRNRGKQVSSETDDDTLLEKVKYLKKRDLIHLATIRRLLYDETSLESILDVLFKDSHKKNQSKLIDDLHKHHHKKKQTKLIDDLHKHFHVQISKNIKDEIYRYFQKRKNIQTINELKKLKRLKNTILAKKENISQKELDEIKRLSELPTNTIRKLVQLRNVESTGLKRSELLYILMRSQKYHKEKEYLSHLQSDPVNKINIMINKIKRFITELGMLLNKSEINIIRKRLNEISKKRPNRRQAKKLEEELTKIFNDLKFKRSHTNSAFDSSSYYGLNDLKYTFGDLDDY